MGTSTEKLSLTNPIRSSPGSVARILCFREASRDPKVCLCARCLIGDDRLSQLPDPALGFGPAPAHRCEEASRAGCRCGCQARMSSCQPARILFSARSFWQLMLVSSHLVFNHDIESRFLVRFQFITWVNNMQVLVCAYEAQLHEPFVASAMMQA